MRHTGIPLPEPLINNDLLIVLVVLLSIAMLVPLKREKSLVYTSIASIFNRDPFFAKNATIGDHIQHYMLLFFSIVGLSLYAIQSIKPLHFTWTEVGLCSAGISSFVITKLLLMHIYFSLFFGKMSRMLIYQYISLIITLGIAGFIGFIFLRYAPLIPPAFIHGITGTISLCCGLTVIFVLLRDFFNRACLFFHFILYLCTLEILPILAAIKWTGDYYFLLSN